MNPEELLAYLQDTMQRIMPELLAQMLGRTQTRISMERDVASREHILVVDLTLEGRSLARYLTSIPEEVLRDGRGTASERRRQADRYASYGRYEPDMQNFFAVLPESTPERIAPRRPGVVVPTLPVRSPERSLPEVTLPERPTPAEVRGRGRRLDFRDDEQDDDDSS